MNGKTPHIVQYQGSKRLLAPQILQYMPPKFDRLVEPFSGMAAITIAVAHEKRAREYYINDVNTPIATILQMAIEHPADIIARYTTLWLAQFDFEGGHLAHFNAVRDDFNSGNQSAENMLYLLARCVKGAIRYGRNGKFNQSPDKRRHGTNPKNLANSIHNISILLKGRVTFSAMDYSNVLATARKGDVVYMDPPYQGVTNTRDSRYLAGLDVHEFANTVEILNTNNVDFLISYDGACGDKEYGIALPKALGCTKILLNAGVSTQATLLGKKHTTYESLYVSRNLRSTVAHLTAQANLFGEAV